MSNKKEIAKQVAHILRILAEKIEDDPDFLKDVELSIKDIPTFRKKRKRKNHPLI